jgi:hypothetical protein
LNVTGLVTAGNLQSNTVVTTTIVPASVSTANATSSSTTLTYTSPTTGFYGYPYATSTINLASTSGVSNYVSGVLASHLSFNYTGSNTVFTVTYYLYRSGTALVTQTYVYNIGTYSDTVVYNIVPFSYYDTGLSANVSYYYNMGVSITTAGTATVASLVFTSGTLISQILKR